MRILILTHYFEPENGAPQRRWSALIERFVAAGHEVDVMAPPPHYPSGKVQPQHRELRAGSTHRSASGARVHRVRYLPHAGGVVMRTLDHLVAAVDSYRRASRAFRDDSTADVIIATAPALESLLAGRALARRFHLPLVAEMRDAWPDLVSHVPGLVSPTGLSARLKHQVHEFVTLLQRSADAVVTTTTTFADVLRKRGITRVAVLRNGTDFARYRDVGADGGEARPGGPLRVLYMGTIGRSQGLDHVIEAASLARARGTRLELRIVGQGADLSRLRRLNHRMGAPAEIHGQIDGAEVLEQYHWADTTLVSLRNWAPFAWTVPSKLYELLAAGKHITAVVRGEAADLVRTTAAGDVVEPGNPEALASLWEDLSRNRRRLAVGDRGRAWVQMNADYDRIAEKYLDLLSEIVDAHRASAAAPH